MLRIFLFLFLFISCSAYAGFKRGNGGFVVSCNEPFLGTRLLDIFEAEFRYGLKVQFANEGDAFARAQLIIDRMARLSPQRHRQLSVWLKAFPQEMTFLNDLNIVMGPDLGVTYVPDSCKVQQLVVQVEPSSPEEKRYTFDRRQWNLLDVDNQAATLVHELIYREAISLENQHISSEPTRLLNVTLHSDQLEKMTLRAWLLLLQGLGFHRGEANGFEIKLNSFSDLSFTSRVKSDLVFFDENRLSMAMLPVDSEFFIQKRFVSFKCLTNLRSLSRSSVAFYPNGKLSSIVLSSPLESERCPDIYFALEGIDSANSFRALVYSLSFNLDGSLDYALGAENPTPPPAWFESIYNQLFVSGDQLQVSRSFRGLDSGWMFRVYFNNNRPVLLVNDHFETNLSKTFLNTSGELREVPNQAKQKIY